MDIILPENMKVAMPGDNMTIHCRLDNQIPLENGLRFALRESKKTIGHGVISKVLKDDVIPTGVARKIKMGEFSFDELKGKLDEEKL